MALRRGRSPLGAALALAAALLALAPASGLAQAFLEAYHTGIDAVERGDWPTAERLMKQATDERPEAAQRLLRHLQFKPYVPWYYLGLARFRQDDCDGALAAWAESERQGVAPTLTETWQEVVAARATCQQRAEERQHTEQAARAARDLLERAETQAQEASGQAGEARVAGVWTTGDPAPADLLRTARQDLASARELLTPASGDQPPEASAVSEAQSRIRQALGALEALRERIAAHRAEIGAQRGTERQRLNDLLGTARHAVAETADLAAKSPAVARDRDALSDRIERADAVRRNGSLDVLKSQRETLAQAIATLRETAAPPPEPLIQAAEAFFSGELRKAVEILDDSGLAESPDARTRAHAALLRAAARFSLWQAGGGADLDLLERARQDVRTAREADPDLTPLQSAFSPRFSAFFEANAGAES